jgi:hypothetical protein
MPLRQSLDSSIDMAWYETFVLCMWWCWERIRSVNSTRRARRNEDDLTSLTDRMPVFEEMKIVSTARETASSCLIDHFCKVRQRWEHHGAYCLGTQAH